MTESGSGVDPTPQPPTCSFCGSAASHTSGLIRDELYCCEHAGCEPHAVPVGHDNPPDDVVEIAAKAIFEVEYPRYSPDASADSNRWSWSGDGTRETLRDECRAYGAAVLAAVVPVLEKQLRTENEELKARAQAVTDLCDQADNEPEHKRISRMFPGFSWPAILTTAAVRAAVRGTTTTGDEK